jgi:hypothetical protein
MVEIDDIAISEVNSRDDFQSENPAFFWDETESVLYVNCSWEGSPKTISIANVAVGIKPNNDIQASEFLLYNPWPNPFTDMLNISADIVQPGNYKLSIQSSTGVIIKQFERNYSQVGRQTFTISLNGNLPKGIYFLTMKGRSGVQVKKVVKY